MKAGGPKIVRPTSQAENSASSYSPHESDEDDYNESVQEYDPSLSIKSGLSLKSSKDDSPTTSADDLVATNKSSNYANFSSGFAPSDRAETLEEKIARITGAIKSGSTIQKSTSNTSFVTGSTKEPLYTPPIASSKPSFAPPDRAETLEEKIARVTGAIRGNPIKSTISNSSIGTPIVSTPRASRTASPAVSRPLSPLSIPDANQSTKQSATSDPLPIQTKPPPLLIPITENTSNASSIDSKLIPQQTPKNEETSKENIVTESKLQPLQQPKPEVVNALRSKEPVKVMTPVVNTPIVPPRNDVKEVGPPTPAISASTTAPLSIESEYRLKDEEEKNKTNSIAFHSSNSKPIETTSNTSNQPSVSPPLPLPPPRSSAPAVDSNRYSAAQAALAYIEDEGAAPRTTAATNQVPSLLSSGQKDPSHRLVYTPESVPDIRNSQPVPNSRDPPITHPSASISQSIASTRDATGFPHSALASVSATEASSRISTGAALSIIADVGSNTASSAPVGETSSTVRVAPDLSSSVPNVPTGLSSSIPNVPTGLSSAVPNVPTGLSSSVPNVSTGLSSTLPNVSTGLSSSVPNVPTGLSSSVPNVSTGLSLSVPNVPTGLSSTLPNVAPGVTSSVPKSVPLSISTASPSVTPTPSKTEERPKKTISGGGRPKASLGSDDTSASSSAPPFAVAPSSGGLITVPDQARTAIRSMLRDRQDEVRPRSQERDSFVRREKEVRGGRRGNESPIKFTPQHRRMPDVNTAVSRIGGKSPEALHQSRVSFEDWSLLRSRGELDDTSSPGDGERAVQVAVRVRPFTVGETQAGPRRVVSVNGDKLILVNPTAFEADPDTIAAAAAAVSLENMRCADWAKVFRFDHCLWSYDPLDDGDTYADQETVHETVGAPIVKNILQGRSSSCFSYGHTGTGKTHTMFGSVVPTDASEKLTSDAGLIPRVFTDVIEGILRDPYSKQDTTMTVSFMEVYNERIRDLLDYSGEPKELRVREHPEYGPYCENLVRIEVRSAAEARKLLFAGHAERAVSHTPANNQSSRSHAIVTLELTPVGYEIPVLTSKTPSKQSTRSSLLIPMYVSTPQSTASSGSGRSSAIVRLQMVDLAGSEKEFSSSGKDDDDDRGGTVAARRSYSSGQVSTMDRKEQKNAEKIEIKMIRKSLSTLGYIIKALGRNVPARGLPYRDSVLTWLLKDSLGGGAHTTMVATISPSHTCYDETLSTLKYAERLCSTGKSGDTTHVSIGDTIDPQLSLALTSEYSRLRKELGGSNPGTRANRLLLKQTISDPQQRLARLDTSVDEGIRRRRTSRSISPRLRTGSSSSRVTKEPVTLSTSNAGELREQYRILHGQLVEMQIELEAARTDRDSLQIELQNLKENSSLGQGDGMGGYSRSASLPTNNRSAISALSDALKEAEREVSELRGICARKEQDAERALNELAEERQARATIEKTTRAQSADLITRMEALQRYCNAIVALKNIFFCNI